MNMDMKRYKLKIWYINKNDILRTICGHKKKKGGQVGEGGDFAEFEILPFEQGYHICTIYQVFMFSLTHLLFAHSTLLVSLRVKSKLIYIKKHMCPFQIGDKNIYV